MAAIKKFFEKKKLDFKFKKAGDGHKLTEDTRSSGGMTAGESGRDAALSRSPPQRPQTSSAAQIAAQAALARSEQQKSGPGFGTSGAAIKAQVKHELEAEKKKAAEAYKLAQIYSKPREIQVDASPILAVNGVYFTSPFTGDLKLEKAAMEERIKDFLYSQKSEEPLMTSALIIYTLNKDPDQIKICVETLCKYFDNISSHPGEEKYCKIRINNKVFQERVVLLDGAISFLISAGFQKCTLPDKEGELDDYILFPVEKSVDSEHFSLLKEILCNAEAIRPELDRNTKILMASENTNEAHRMDVPAEFYNITPEEMKREQQAKQEAVERLGMLKTKEMRERERQRELRRYRYCLIRVRFPDSTILQGTFKAFEKFSAVIEFVQQNIEMDWVPFHLTGRTGTKYSDHDLTLAECGLAPAAVLHFSFDADVLAEITSQQKGMQKINYLKLDLLAHAISL